MASAKAAKYRGSIGRTRSEWVMYSHPEGERTMVEIYRSIDASTDPALARRLADPGSSQPINTAQLDERGPVRTIETPVVYHDPERPLLALVLPESYRHRELEARRDLLDALARDQEPVPDYAADFTTVFGSEGLARLLTEQQDREAELEKRAIRLRDDQDDVAQHRRSLETRAAELETRAATLSGREAELDRRLQEINDREHAISERSDSLARRAAAIEQRTMELAKQRAELHDRADRSRAAQAIEAAQAPATAVQPAKPAAAPAAAVEPGIQEPTVPTRRFEPEELSDDATSGDSVSRIRPGGAEVQVSVTNVALESDASPLQSETTQKRPRPDAALQKWLSSSDSVLAGKDPSGLTRFAIATDERTLTALQADHLQVKLQLHRQPAYPVPSLAVAPAGALEQEDSGVYWCFDFDIQEPAERALLEDLGRDFRFAIDLYSVDKEPVTRRIVTAEVADNVPYLLAAADAHLAAIDASTRSVARAKLALSAPAYDRFGLGHPERASFRDDRLRNLGRPIDVRRALSVARRFSKPEREKYLVLERGYSLSKWRSRRDRCIARAIELGLWIGPRLAQIAIAEGMEPSRSALVAKLLDNFSELTAGGAHGLDDVAVRENWEALREEASTLGLGRAGQRRSEPMHS